MVIWKPIAGYEGLYEVSDSGLVRSLCAGRWKTTMLRKPVPDKDGYLTVILKKDGKCVNHKIHRLVAEAFLPNKNNLPVVNHKDENKQNNTVSNLEWCTHQYNLAYGSHATASCKPVIAVDGNGKKMRFASIREAATQTKTNETCISMVLHGRRKSAGGYVWTLEV